MGNVCFFYGAAIFIPCATVQCIVPNGHLLSMDSYVAAKTDNGLKTNHGHSFLIRNDKWANLAHSIS